MSEQLIGNNSTSLQSNGVGMKKLSLTISFFVLSAGFLVAQTGELIIKNSGKGLYIEHKIGAKENFYSIGRSYNVHPKHLATYNSMDMSKGLSLGQVIRIPLTDTNFSQKTETDMPVYYVVGDKEGLYRMRIKKMRIKNKRTVWVISELLLLSR